MLSECALCLQPYLAALAGGEEIAAGQVGLLKHHSAEGQGLGRGGLGDHSAEGACGCPEAHTQFVGAEVEQLVVAPQAHLVGKGRGQARAVEGQGRIGQVQHRAGPAPLWSVKPLP